MLMQYPLGCVPLITYIHIYVYKWDWIVIFFLKFCTDKHFSDFQTFDIPFLCREIGSFCADTEDEEKQQGLPVGMLNDRDKVNKPGSQHGPLAIKSTSPGTQPNEGETNFQEGNCDGTGIGWNCRSLTKLDVHTYFLCLVGDVGGFQSKDHNNGNGQIVTTTTLWLVNPLIPPTHWL